jgi:hypothetical protein
MRWLLFNPYMLPSLQDGLLFISTVHLTNITAPILAGRDPPPKPSKLRPCLRSKICRTGVLRVSQGMATTERTSDVNPMARSQMSRGLSLYLLLRSSRPALNQTLSTLQPLGIEEGRTGHLALDMPGMASMTSHRLPVPDAASTYLRLHRSLFSCGSISKPFLLRKILPVTMSVLLLRTVFRSSFSR